MAARISRIIITGREGDLNAFTRCCLQIGTLDEIAVELDISDGSVHILNLCIYEQYLEYRKLALGWVLRLLVGKHKGNVFESALTFLIVIGRKVG